MASLNAYAQSLRNDKRLDKEYEEGVPFFVPQLSKVKTSVMCQGKSQKLLFNYERRSSVSPDPSSPLTLPYRKQGNQKFYTEENLKKRQKLMGNPKILKAIERFWDTFACIRRGGDTISMREYVDVFMKLYKALVTPSDFSIGEARCIVEKDWAKDSDNCERLSKTLFVSALFEVVDIWTTNIGVKEYIAFLNKLFKRVTVTIYDHVKMQWMIAFAELDTIRSFDDPNFIEENGEECVDNNNVTNEANAVPRPPFLRNKTRSASAFLSASNNDRLPELNFARRGQNDGWNSSRSDELSYSCDDQLFENETAKTRSDEGSKDKRRQFDDEVQSEPSTARLSRPMFPDISPPHVLLHLPNIYLNPDLTDVHEAECAARRRLRRNARLVQNVRRILSSNHQFQA
ncbi:uncharacterized protein PHALS_04817 [Plasmopara halstedii]|uniref:Uncharacterized protein n=1 Tax=Plasmopara halstedii TaxID=4781 RepID=A0A0P1AYX2_PLAHL|nr:uncharacterized protein PHALS_04817 [Plasmopara halstedii]CEG47669.1 hypothetical protein PHALS_04817 [Plasmopara halstedii]|eukprot:XP_024584038.1 hypothetical protein PHALS_04817 [Plasmopara halstedii]